MLLTDDFQEYLTKVRTAAHEGSLDPSRVHLSQKCPECDRCPAICDPDHVMGYSGPNGWFVLVGCEGYWVLDPNEFGIERPNWSPLT